MNQRINPILPSLGFLFAILPVAPVQATSLNQIVMPDIQPYGQLSLSYQQQDPNIANPTEHLAELGITKRAEAAVFRGYNPHEFDMSFEYSLAQKGPYLLSTGFTNWSSRVLSPQPFLEGGFYRDRNKYAIGAMRSGGETQGMVGYAYQVSPRLALQFDYQAGSGNASTAGFTYNITPQLQFNPAVYYSNSEPHRPYAYGVLTWNIQAWQ